jgi:hypothetical protein
MPFKYCTIRTLPDPLVYGEFGRIFLAFSQTLYRQVGFEILTAASMEMAVFCDVAPCSLVEVYRRFRGTCCLIIEVASNSETSVNY